MCGSLRAFKGANQRAVSHVAVSLPPPPSRQLGTGGLEAFEDPFTLNILVAFVLSISFLSCIKKITTATDTTHLLSYCFVGPKARQAALAGFSAEGLTS